MNQNCYYLNFVYDAIYNEWRFCYVDKQPIKKLTVY
jgi:hypothetical protein